ncbi:uncharacterized protein LOC143539158 [Bidens hawaiensis]|uniref:uncharacterized protein LOC143539158 n=1 Tax=Bidens hawaiensis TaxID=980011 RepID=UPI00404AF57B
MSQTTTTTTTKRHLEANDVVSQPETPKRLKNTYNNNHNNNNINNNNVIINQQDATTQYLLDFFTTIPFEPDPFLNPTQQPEPDPEDDDEQEKLMKHLFEASDDELGIPSMAVDDVSRGEDDVTGFGDIGLWELEDEVANYYTLVQSEQFMQ